MQNNLLRLSGRRGIIVGLQLDSLLTALQLSVAEYSTIDLAFNPVVRRYVAQLAQAAGYEEALIARMFPLDVRYKMYIRYLAVLLFSDQFLFELHPTSKHDPAHEMIFTAALTQTLSTAYCDSRLYVQRPNMPDAAL